MAAARFLPAWLYASAAIAWRERNHYASRCWHPVAAVSELGRGEAMACELLGLPLLLTRPDDGAPRAFLNRCPHRGVALVAAVGQARPCRRLICPYHGWNYGLDGQLQAAAREGDFIEPFRRSDWPLQELPCRVLGPLIWVAPGKEPLPLEEQLDLVLAEAGELFERPRQLLARERRPLLCNWKIAHDNTLDDYHVAIAHPTTLHREQGPVRDYRHAFSAHGNLLATPHGDAGTFYTFGLVPWTHLLLWPDGRLALISFLPELPLQDGETNTAEGCCTMEVWLLGHSELADTAEAWMAEMRRFLEEDRRLVESAQRAYASGLEPGPAHRLERRILQWQALYSTWMDLSPDSLSAARPPWPH
jgi:phenylpropionate dioxygenase-like ring-hydroxylating dioxygenase large terminal subunit